MVESANHCAQFGKCSMHVDWVTFTIFRDGTLEPWRVLPSSPETTKQTLIWRGRCVEGETVSGGRVIAMGCVGWGQ